jgi:beta-barrel assembly-enhancing protease
VTILNDGSGRPRGGGCGLRVILALAILIIGSASYYFTTQTNPITGEKQRVSLTPDQEMQLGLQAAPEMASEMGGELDSSNRREQQAKALGQRLASVLPNNPYQFAFHVLRDPETVNAFALPGGQVFITQALFDRLRTEAQLAGVLGHEVGHVVNRHAAQQMAHEQFYQSIVIATGVGAGDNRAAALAQYVTQIRSLKYSREDELQADQWGMKLMSQIGYDPREMLKVMEILKSLGSSGSEMLSTHPLPESRIERIQEYLAKTYPQGVPATLGTGPDLR